MANDDDGFDRRSSGVHEATKAVLCGYHWNARSLFPHRCWVLFCFSSTSHRLNRLLFYVYFVNCYKQFHPPPHRAHNTNGGCSFRIRRPSISLPSQSCCYCLCCLACLVIFIESRLSMALLHIFRLFFIVVYLLCVMSCVVSTVYVYDGVNSSRNKWCFVMQLMFIY